MNSTEKLLIAAPFTPMNPDQSVNLDLIPAYGRFLQHNGVKGAFICGSTGEGPSLSLQEKKHVFSAWGDLSLADFYTIGLVGGTCLSDCQEMAKHAAACRLDAISLLAPYYVKPSTLSELVSFCSQVAQVVPYMPVYYYHIPALSGVHFPMREFLKAAEHKIPNLKGIKFTHPDLMDFHACIKHPGKAFHMLWGRDEVLLGALAMGAHGAVGSTYNYMSPIYVRLLQAFYENDLKQALACQTQANAYIDILLDYGGMAPGKLFMKLVGMNCGDFRPPIPSLSAEIQHEMTQKLEAAGFYSLCSKKPS